MTLTPIVEARFRRTPVRAEYPYGARCATVAISWRIGLPVHTSVGKFCLRRRNSLAGDSFDMPREAEKPTDFADPHVLWRVFS